MPATITRDQVEQRLADALVEFGAEPGEITSTASFEALDVDSLDLVELAQVVQDEYGVVISGEDMPGLKTVDDAVRLVMERAEA